jgi:hypothetical protein
MSNVIRFLETLGAQPAMSNAEYAAAVAHLDAAPEPKRALLGRNPVELSDLLGGRARMICMVATPQPDSVPDRSPDEQEQETPDEGEEESK